MFKKSILLVLLLNTVFSFSQEIVNTIPIELKKNKDVFQIVNDSLKEVSFFINDNEKIKTIRVDSEMKILDSLTTARIEPDTYNHIIGYINKSKNPSLIWASSNGKKLMFQNFNFENKKTTTTYQLFDNKGEKLLQKFSFKDKFYMLTILKNSNNLKFYVFDDTGNYKEKLLDFSKFRFISSDNAKINLYDIFSESFYQNEFSFSLQKVTTNGQSSLVESSKKRKCYLKGNNLIFTLDVNNNFTQIYHIDLNTYTISENILSKPFINSSNPEFIDTNSFLIDNKLFQIVSSSTDFVLDIKNLDGISLNTYALDENSTNIQFKNTEINQENVESTNKRVLEKPSQFIRKTHNLSPGITCYNFNNNYLVSLGGVSELQQSNTATIVMGGMFGLVGAIAVSIIDASNPAILNVNPYANRKVVYVNCLFDKELNHLEGDIKPLAFDKIRTFFEKNNKISNQSMFQLNDLYYLGYYDKESKQYTIRKFED